MCKITAIVGLMFIQTAAAMTLAPGVSVPPDARESESYAAKEWCDWSSQVTGRACAVVPEKAAGVVLRRDDALPEDAFRLTVEKDKLVIAGGARGLLYGVYEALERFAGIRWYAADTTRVPKRATIDVPEDLKLESKPDFRMRSVFWCDYVKDGDFAARRRVNANAPLEARHGGLPYRFGKGVWACHTLGKLVPASEFFATHPEYFGEIGGVRSGGNQLCLTNPDVLKIVVDRIKERIRADPGARFYGVSQDDHDHYCRCAACAAVDAEEGSHAGCVVRFVNAVAAEVEKEFPHAIIETLAYTYSRFPPKKTRLRHNVVPCICSIECGFGPDPIAAGTTDANRKFADLLRGWAKQTDQLYLWDYTTDFSEYFHIFPNVGVLQPNLQFFRDCGVRYVFEQGNSNGRHGFLAELKGYLLSKWLWDADLPEEELVRDFTDGYYGAGGAAVRQFLKELDACVRDYARAHPGYGAGVYERAEKSPYTKEFIARADALWRQAESAAAGDAVAVRNVRAGRVSIAFERFVADPNPQTAQELDTLSRENKADRWCETLMRSKRRTAQIANLLPGDKPWSIPGWNIIWADEFNDDTSLDSLCWKHDSKMKEGSEPRLAVTNGCLCLRPLAGGNAFPIRERAFGRGFPSVNSDVRFTAHRGRFELRAKLPKGRGLFPKFWLIGDGHNVQQWPWCGEIDVVRGAGDGTGRVFSGACWSDKTSTAKDGLCERTVGCVPAPTADGFHVYSAEWDERRIVFSVDGKTYGEVKLSDISPNVRGVGPFDQAHYLLIGLDAAPAADTSAEMLVDWVRVYERNPTP